METPIRADTAGRHENPAYVYIIEVLSACLVCYFLYLLFPRYPMIWAMVYAGVVISPIREKSRVLVFSRIKANILGSLVGFVIMAVHEPNIFLFCVGLVATTLLCKYLKTYTTVRSSVVALIVIMIPVYSEAHTRIALERMICVIIGCAIAFLVTVFFDSLTDLLLREGGKEPPSGPGSQDEA